MNSVIKEALVNFYDISLFVSKTDFIFRFKLMHSDHLEYQSLLHFVAGGSLLCGIGHLCLGLPPDDITVEMI